MERGQSAISGRLRQVAWRDLVPMRRIDGCRECLHPLPWLLGSWLCAGQAVWPAAAAFSFMFFLTALRLNHEAIHGNVGLGRRGHAWLLPLLSALMLGSNSAGAVNHPKHPAHPGDARDLEGKAGRMGPVRGLAYGSLFPFETHAVA